MTRTAYTRRSPLGLVIERLIFEPGFRAALAQNIDQAVAGYGLTELERDLLVERLVEDALPSQLRAHDIPQPISSGSLVSGLDEFVAHGGLASIGAPRQAEAARRVS
ncbi:MAG: hypothetical protein GEU86_12140 [Actinophytocola sp.]|nr:hypothetical protein [Actinophytocola sp.]